MKQYKRMIAGYTDYNYHGTPTKFIRVGLTCSPLMSDDETEIAKENQEKELLSRIHRCSPVRGITVKRLAA